jgi:AcrR family transcriptional regulator
MSPREAQRERTRVRILDAVLALVAESPGPISVPAVARRSGVSVPTIYRYFPTKDALLDAAAEEPGRRAAGGVPDAAMTDGPEYLRKVWASFTSTLPLVRRQLASDAGREMRRRRYERSRTWFERTLAADGIDPGTDAGARLTRLALLLTSSLAFVDLHDRQGRTPDEAADDVVWAVAALTAATRAEDADRA